MKITRTTLLLAAALFLTTSTQARPNKAIIRSVRNGAAEVTTDGKTWKPARIGQQLGERASIKTDPNATVDLFLGDNGPAVRVTKDTTLAIDRLDSESTGIEKIIQTQLNLQTGKILGNVRKMAAASRYEIKTPAGVASIRGTEYSITADGRVQVYSGTVHIVYVIDNIPQPQITITAGKESHPPLVNQPARIADIMAPDSNIDTLMDGITRNPDGSWTVVPPLPRKLIPSLDDVLIIFPLPQDFFPSNFDITNGCLDCCISCTEPLPPPEIPGEP